MYIYYMRYEIRAMYVYCITVCIINNDKFVYAQLVVS